jgi:hypothetical protein
MIVISELLGFVIFHKLNHYGLQHVQHTLIAHTYALGPVESHKQIVLAILHLFAAVMADWRPSHAVAYDASLV